MMKIKILISCSGFNFSFRQGEIREVDDYIAKDLINVGYAEAVADTEPKESAESEKPKTSKRTRSKSTAKKDVNENVADS